MSWCFLTDTLLLQLKWENELLVVSFEQESQHDSLEETNGDDVVCTFELPPEPLVYHRINSCHQPKLPVTAPFTTDTQDRLIIITMDNEGWDESSILVPTNLFMKSVQATAGPKGRRRIPWKQWISEYAQIITHFPVVGPCRGIQGLKTIWFDAATSMIFIYDFNPRLTKRLLQDSKYPSRRLFAEPIYHKILPEPIATTLPYAFHVIQTREPMDLNVGIESVLADDCILLLKVCATKTYCTRHYTNHYRHSTNNSY